MIHVLPGMGADQRMYPGPWRSLPDCNFIDWPDYGQERTINALARRVIATEHIQPGSVLIGSSLGGMVACEIANLISIERLVLIGSAKSKAEIGGLLRLLHPLVDLTPLSLIQKAAGQWPGVIAQMFKDRDPAFIRAMIKAIFIWDGLQPHGLKVFRIHGDRDPVIPAPPEVDHLLHGGHFVAMTHADECVELVRPWLPCSALNNAAGARRPSRSPRPGRRPDGFANAGRSVLFSSVQALR